MTALIDNEYKSISTPDLAELKEYSSIKVLSDSVSTELKILNSLAIVPVACPWFLAHSADSMDLTNWSQSRALVTFMDDEQRSQLG